METTEKGNKKFSINLERILGLILLIPPLLGVFLFVLNLLFSTPVDIPSLSHLSSHWTGDYYYSRFGDGGGGGFTSAAPIYLGLMAIAGSILLKGSDKNKY